MAVVTYTCDVCKRSIDVPENKRGLTVVQRCIITAQCKGKLHQVSANRDYTRGQRPPSVEGLDDWKPRSALYNFKQTIKSNIWEIEHNLGNNPAVLIYVLDDLVDPPVLKEVSIDSVKIVTIDSNNLTITFPKAEAGQVQCISRATVPAKITAQTSVSTTQITHNGELTIATNDNVWDHFDTIPITITFITPVNTYASLDYEVGYEPSLVNSAWANSSSIFLKNRKYTVRSFNVINDNPSFTNGTIPNGSKISSIQYTGSSGKGDDIIVLLANSPYTIYDKIIDKYISFDYVAANVLINNEELYAYDSIIEVLYPSVVELPPRPGPFWSIGGETNGLLGTAILQNNGGNNLPVLADGAFEFTTKVLDGLPYNVTVLTQPVSQLCLVTNGSGTAAANVTTVTLTCYPAYYIGGTLSGLVGTVILRNNSENLTLSDNGAFVFPTAILDGGAYDVEVFSQPLGQTCTITNGSGTVAGSDITDVTIICTINGYLISVTVSGLTGSLTLQNNGGDDLTIPSDGTYAFTTPVPSGSNYDVTVLANPPGQTCTVTNGSGTVAGGNVTDITVSAVDNIYTVGGTITGLNTPASIVIQDNSSDNTTLSANGTFQFPTTLYYGDAYDVTVLTQQTGQWCVVSNGSGTVTANISDIAITCGWAVQVHVSGLLTGESVVFQVNGGNDLTVTADGDWSFHVPFQSGDPYSVTILTQPINQTVTFNGGFESGTVLASTVFVDYVAGPKSYTVGGNVSGLTGTVVLQDNSGDDLSISANGAFTFPTPIIPLNPGYQVVNFGGNALSGPMNYCGFTLSGIFNYDLIVDGVGVGVLTFYTDALTTWDLLVSNLQYSIDNRVSGPGADVSLESGNIVFRSKTTGASSTVSVSSSIGNSFTSCPSFVGIDTAVPGTSSEPYDVTVLTQPDGQTCVVAYGSGSITNSDVTDVVVTCAGSSTVLLHMNGSDGATIFHDSSAIPHTITNNNAATISADVLPLSGTGLVGKFVAASQQWIQTGVSADIYLKQEFTIEGLIRPISYPGSWCMVLYITPHGSGTVGAYLQLQPGGGLYWFFYTPSGSVAVSSGPGAIPLNEWTEFAVTRDFSDVTRLFINGVLVGSSTAAVPVDTTPLDFTVGTYSPAPSAGISFNGYLDEINFVNGICNYTTSYTPTYGGNPGTTNISIDNPTDGFLWGPGSQNIDFTVSGGPGINYVYVYWNGVLRGTYDNTGYRDTDFSDTAFLDSPVISGTDNDNTTHTLMLVVEDIYGDTSVSTSITGKVSY